MFLAQFELRYWCLNCCSGGLVGVLVEIKANLAQLSRSWSWAELGNVNLFSDQSSVMSVHNLLVLIPIFGNQSLCRIIGYLKSYLHQTRL